MYEDGQYLENNPTWHEQDSTKKAEWIDSLLTTHGVRPGTVAEVGCGAGGILRELAARRPEIRVEGWDISPQVLSIARSRVSASAIEFHEGDILASGKSWDLLLAIDVLEHMENPAAFLRACRGRFGNLMVHLPLDISLQSVVRPKHLLGQRKRLGHIHMFTAGLARSLVEENGWSVVGWRYTAGALELPLAPGWRNWLKNAVMRPPRRILQAIAPDFSVRILGGCSILLLLEPSTSS